MPPLKTTAQATALQVMFALPRRLRRLIAGPPVRLDGQELALDAQLLLRMQQLGKFPPMSQGTPAQARRHLDGGTVLVSGPPIPGVDTRDLRIDTVGARLYTPSGLAEGSPLLLYFHGGGFVLGSLDSHDNTCRFLAKHAQVRVLAVDYRLAPEHPFPAGVLDAVAAFEYAHANARELGADPSAIAVGGDSAGGNLATVTAYLSVQAGGPKPAYQLLFYPATDSTVRTRSQELFSERFLLTQEDMDWFTKSYATSEEDKHDPRYSPMLAPDLSGMPPAYIATAGFDPLRDEGEAYAERLRAAGVPVVQSRHADLIHGYANFLAVGTRFREALFEAVGALRTGLGVSQKIISNRESVKE